MKKSLSVLCAGAMLFALAGCTTQYVMTTTNGHTLVAYGKPEVDANRGITRYVDEYGYTREISSSDVVQVAEKQ
ncbi:MAG: YgdI/YgdR family lipoprotein [Kluyvera sp.]